MTNETIKVLLMVMLFGGLRLAIFVTEMPKSQPWFVLHPAFLDWMVALFWPSMPEPASRAAPISMSARASSGLRGRNYHFRQSRVSLAKS